MILYGLPLATALSLMHMVGAHHAATVSRNWSANEDKMDRNALHRSKVQPSNSRKLKSGLAARDNSQLFDIFGYSAVTKWICSRPLPVWHLMLASQAKT